MSKDYKKGFDKGYALGLKEGFSEGRAAGVIRMLTKKKNGQSERRKQLS